MLKKCIIYFSLFLTPLLFTDSIIYEDFYICLGSFFDIDNVIQFQDTLKQQDIETTLEQFDKDGITYTRVFIKESYKKYNTARYELKNMSYDFEKKNINLKGLWIKKGQINEYTIPNEIITEYKKKAELRLQENIKKDQTDDKIVIKEDLLQKDLLKEDVSSDKISTKDQTNDLNEIIIEEEYDFNDLTVENIVTSESLKNELETLAMWENYMGKKEFSNDTAKTLILQSIENFKKIKSYFANISSKNNSALNDAIKNQLDLCAVYEKIEESFTKENDLQKVFKYFYTANNHYNMFIENLEKAQEYEETVYNNSKKGK